MKIKIILLLILFTLIGCKNKNGEHNIDVALSEVIAKFPQILKGRTNHYQFEKSIKNGKYGFEIQLYSQLDTVRDPQKIMVFINSKKECYAIPFLSNTYRDYWEFRNEKILSKVKRVNTTFTKQYVAALNSLDLNKREIYYVLTNEILTSLLNCDRVGDKDSDFLKGLFFFNNNGFESDENDKESKEKLLKNYEEIKTTPNTDINFHNNQIYFGYLDYKNFRFYQVVYKYEHVKHPTIKGKEIIFKTVLQIKSYRHDIVNNMMSGSI
nr:hypothetical protein [uncultured Flavobacterium sp.]